MKSVGELGVNDARNFVGLRWDVDVCGRKVISPLRCLSATGPLVGRLPSGDSSRISYISAGLDGLLLGPRILGARFEIRTQFCRLCPFLALGLPFNADGFAGRNGVSHWNGMLSLLVLDDKQPSADS